MGVSTWQSGQLEGEQSGEHPWTPAHRWLTAPCPSNVLTKDTDELWEACVGVAIQNRVSETLV